MPKLLGQPNHSHASTARLGVLLCNLGTPTAPTPTAVRRYLAEFLSDPRLIELPRVLWLPILYGLVLTLRPFRAAHAYAKIWTPEGSPLRVYSEQQQVAIGAALEARFPGRITVALAMRYGEPSIARALADLAAANARRILVLPLYPQYSSPSTGAVFDAVARALQAWRWVPELRFIASYHDEPAYIAALTNSVREHWAMHGRAERLLVSFHGVPRKYFLAGDPYFCHCQATARLLAAALELADHEWQVVFQSRFGRARWLEPYASETLTALARDGIKTIDIVCPGFAADCLETLEEIVLQNAALLRAAGGAELRYVPALNARADHIAMLCELITRNLSGWPLHTPPEDSAQARVARARTLGAAQ